MIRLEKERILFIYCLARQAERSIDFALRAPWEEFRQFYSEDRLAMLESVVEILHGLAPKGERSIITADLVYSRGFLWVLSYPLNCWLNRFRSTWQFRLAQIRFFSQTFVTAVETIKCNDKPSADDLIRLRMDLHCCEMIIEHKLCGLPILLKAASIEHFLQSDFMPHRRLEEICPAFVRQTVLIRQGQGYD